MGNNLYQKINKKNNILIVFIKHVKEVPKFNNIHKEYLFFKKSSILLCFLNSNGTKIKNVR